MKYFPKLERENKYINSYMKHDRNTIQSIVYAYLVLGMSHMDIENQIMNISGRGYECMYVLHYLGIKPKHKALFKNISLTEMRQSLLESIDDAEIILKVFENIEKNSFLQDVEGITRMYIHKIKKHYVKKTSEEVSSKDLEAYYNSEMKVRNANIQRKFRNDLINEFGGKCALCQISQERLLKAAHILPYSRCNGDIKHAGNKNNGLLLCVLHDALFESGDFISFDNGGKIMIKETIPIHLYGDLRLREELKIHTKYLNKERKKYLKKHNLMFLN